jgi:hypothetical protein
VIVRTRYVAKNSKELSKEINQVSPERDKGFWKPDGRNASSAKADKT